MALQFSNARRVGHRKDKRMNRNYQKELDRLLDTMEKENKVPTLLLHSCCAPCSSYILEYLSQYFAITVFYYNPNIFPELEYHHRVQEQQEFIAKIPQKYPIQFVEGVYDTKRFYDTVRGHEADPEGGERCYHCYELRLRETMEVAEEGGFDYYTTSLSISPYKNAKWLNEIGERLSEGKKVKYLPSDFKKKNGYKRSVELSSEYGMYRQDYCGCVYSMAERDAQKRKAEFQKTMEQKE